MFTFGELMPQLSQYFTHLSSPYIYVFDSIAFYVIWETYALIWVGTDRGDMYSIFFAFIFKGL